MRSRSSQRPREACGAVHAGARPQVRWPRVSRGGRLVTEVRLRRQSSSPQPDESGRAVPVAAVALPSRLRPSLHPAIPTARPLRGCGRGGGGWWLGPKGARGLAAGAAGGVGRWWWWRVGLVTGAGRWRGGGTRSGLGGFCCSARTSNPCCAMGGGAGFPAPPAIGGVGARVGGVGMRGSGMGMVFSASTTVLADSHYQTTSLITYLIINIYLITLLLT